MNIIRRGSAHRQAALRFRSRIEIIGVNPYVLVDADGVSQLKQDWRRPMPVTFKVDDGPETWRVNLMPVGDGTFRLYLNTDIREAADLDVGDTCVLDVQFDEEYRNGPLHPMPSWFDKELDRNPLARSGWEQLIPSRQKEILRYFARLKSPEAKQRNVRRALNVLAGERARFMGRMWNEGGTPIRS
jgi:hypothetical protein